MTPIESLTDLTPITIEIDSTCIRASAPRRDPYGNWYKSCLFMAYRQRNGNWSLHDITAGGTPLPFGNRQQLLAHITTTLETRNVAYAAEVAAEASPAESPSHV